MMLLSTSLSLPESYTAKPYYLRKAPSNPALRPMSQGANPFSDRGCLQALELCGKYLLRAVADKSDREAREGMMLAATLAGIAFGNAGVHVPHAVSYGASGHACNFHPGDGYPVNSTGKSALIPHGMSVILNAPAVFRFTADACPERHLRAAAALGADIQGATLQDGGEIIARHLISMLRAAGFPSGLSGVGFTSQDISNLTKSTLPQKRLLDNSPKHIGEAELELLFQQAMSYH